MSYAPARPTVALEDIVDVDALRRAIAERYINVSVHPRGGYTLLDYAPRAQYERFWTTETKTCRGLIVAGDPRTGDATVVARPFAKFANVQEHGSDSPFGVLPVGLPMEVFAKLDGSLAILHETEHGVALSTRGSFESRQARAATRLWHRRYGDYPVPAGATMLFEFVAPWNRIVVPYDSEELVLLAVIDNATGADLPLPADWPGPVVERFDGWGDLDQVREHVEAMTRDDFEGFVVRFVPQGPVPSVRTKLKLAEYVRLHRIVTGVSTKTLWAHLSEGRPFDDLLDRVPDELYRWVQDTVADLRARYDEIESRAAALAAEVSGLPRKDAAAVVLSRKDEVNTAVVFNMLSGWPYAEKIWKQIRPQYERPFMSDVA